MARIYRNTFIGSCTGLSKLRRLSSTTMVATSGSHHSSRTEIFWFSVPIDCLSLHAKVALLKKLNLRMRSFSSKSPLTTLHLNRFRISSAITHQMMRKKKTVAERIRTSSLKKCSKSLKTPSTMPSMTKASTKLSFTRCSASMEKQHSSQCTCFQMKTINCLIIWRLKTSILSSTSA